MWNWTTIRPDNDFNRDAPLTLETGAVGAYVTDKGQVTLSELLRDGFERYAEIRTGVQDSSESGLSHLRPCSRCDVTNTR